MTVLDISKAKEHMLKIRAGELTYDKDSHYLQMIQEFLTDLPFGSTLYLDLKQVKMVDDTFAFWSVWNLTCVLGRGPVKGKHLVIQNLNPPVLSAIDKYVNEEGEAYLYLDSTGILKIRGDAFSSLHRTTLEVILRSRKAYLTGSEIHERTGISSLGLSSRILKQLFDWGFVNREIAHTKRGRPLFKNFAYWPKKAKAWEISPGITINRPNSIKRAS